MKMNRRYILLPLAALMALSLAGCGMFASGPGATVTKFMTAVDKGDTVTAANLVSARIRSMLGDAKLQAGLQQQGQEMKAQGGLKTVTIQKEETKGDVAEVTALVIFGNGTQKPDTSKLVKESGGWKLDAPDKH